MSTFRLIVKEALISALAITVGAIMVWLLLSVGYHFGREESKGRRVMEDSPYKIIQKTHLHTPKNLTNPDSNISI